ncbi:hypothetical protein CTRI78_v000826 [Colletotrichum trifolii]|uniref:Uncharacterized protein n=1 Tax=Colletotrichum trifolii TaxID=5466 RepID=A0A4R8RRS1_COLTR|nr:hypothetical protein CTRI78_v000826 [Colletotrichum trifolii]
MPSFFDRSSSEERDVAIRLLPGQRNSADDGQDCIEDLLRQVALGHDSVRAIVTAGDERFVLYATKVDETVKFNLSDAVERLTRFVTAESSPCISVFYRVGKEDGLEEIACLATLNRAQAALTDSLSWNEGSLAKSSLNLQRGNRAGNQLSWPSRPAALKTIRPRVAALWSGLAVIILVLVAVYRTSSHVGFRQHFEKGIWVRYDVKDSEGPRYQLQFSRHNVSDWENPYSDGEWAVRIDDQAIVPASLMDEDELRYQKWFRQRYPGMRDVVDNKDYLSKEFLGDPDRLKVPADWLFHPAHCILALRRYWKAKESGRHVCPRDIDHRHIHHCLDSLDEWFFIGGEMRKPPPKPTDYEAEWSLVWKTKVCW